MTIKAQTNVPAENLGATPVPWFDELYGKEERKFPVVEVFGPTIQGEGMDQGAPCYFIRFGGCDYHCEWCDTPFAVLPELVRRNAEKLTAQEIVDRVLALAPGPQWVVLSGGNPLLHNLYRLCIKLRNQGFKVAVETQGTMRKPWLLNVQRVAVSPKPPSSGHLTTFRELHRFMEGLSVFNSFLKVVVFDDNDYQFAKSVHKWFPGWRMYLSVGNDAGATVGHPGRQDTRSQAEVVNDLCDRGRWLANRVMVDTDMHDVQLQMQSHVLWWGNERGH